MKRVIKAAYSFELGRYADYYEIDDPSRWNLPDTEEVLAWYIEVCSKNGYEFIDLVEAKDPYYSEELDRYSSLVAARDGDGEICLLDIDGDRVKDVTFYVDAIIDNEIEV